MSSSESWKSFLERPCDETFVPLYESTKRLAWTLCVRILGNEADALDAFQGAYARLLVLAREGGMESAAEPPGQIVARAAIREADRLRKSRAREAAGKSRLAGEKLVNSDATGHTDEVERRDTRERIEQLVSELPERYRLPVQLHYLHGLSQREVAQALDAPLSTVAERIQAGLGRLDPGVRRAGLGPARVAFAGLAASAMLLEPRLSAAAAYQGAESVAAAISASGLQASTLLSTTTVLGGLGLMAAKSAFLAAALFLLLIGGFIAFRHLQPEPPRAPSGEVARVDEPAAPPPASAPKAEAVPATRVADIPTPGSVDAILGVVADTVTREPIPGALVKLGFPSNAVAVADAEGRYRLERPGEGAFQLVASAEGHASQSAQLKHTPGKTSPQSFHLDPSLKLRVMVIDVDARPVPGARLTPPNCGTEGIYSSENSVQADDHGVVELPGVSRLHAPQIQVQKEGFQPKYFSPRAIDEQEELEVKVILERIVFKRRVIVGRVADASNQPISGAVIEWKDGEGTSFGDGVIYGQFKAMTSLDGTYRLEYDDDFDTCSLGVAARGFGPLVVENVRPGTPEAPLERNFTLDASHWISGRVVDEDDKPLASVEIRAMPALGHMNDAVAFPSVIRTARSDEMGRFRLDEVSGPRVGADFRARDSRPMLSQELEVDREVVVVLPGFSTLRGVIVDQESNLPVTAFNIKLSGISLDSARLASGETFASSEGRFALERLEHTTRLELIIAAEGYVTSHLTDIDPRKAPPEGMRIAMTKGQMLTGQIVDPTSGAPVSEVIVLAGPSPNVRGAVALNWKWLEQSLTRARIEKLVSDGEGKFELREGEPATLAFRAAGRQRLVIEPAERRQYRGKDGVLRIPLGKGARLSGQCYFGGELARDTDVTLEHSGGTWSAKNEEERTHGTVTTDGDGRFLWDDLSAGAYVIRVARRIAGPSANFELRLRKSVTVGTGEAFVEIGKDPGPRTLQGQIAGMADRESLGITVTLRPLFDDGSEQIWFQTYKDWGWGYTCPFLRPGRYGVEVQFWENHATRTLELEPIEVGGDSEPRIEVPPGA